MTNANSVDAGFGSDGAQSANDFSRPLYGASFGAAVKRFFGQYAKFHGRASRSEYWWVQLFVALVGVVPNVLASVGAGLAVAWAAANPVMTNVGYDASGQGVSVATAPGIVHAPTATLMFVGLGLAALVSLAMLVPQLALLWRRLHDANLPGAVALLGLVPLAGGLIVLVLTLLPPRAEGRRFDRRS